MSAHPLRIFTGSSHPNLAREVTEILGVPWVNPQQGFSMILRLM